MLWYQASYFDEFLCKCGDCRSSCCDAWEIAVSEEEYHRLSNLTCSDDMFRKIQCAFREIDNPTPKRYRLFARNFIGCCPMHAENGLCALQVELGAAVLPQICRVYPRSMHCKGGKRRAVCSAGCEAVIELLNTSEPISIDEKENDLPIDITCEAQEGFFEFFKSSISILQNRNTDLKTRLDILCQKLQPSYVPSNDQRSGLIEVLNAIDKLKDYSPTLSNFAAALGNRYLSFENYTTDLDRFNSDFPNWEHLFENLFVNHLIYEDFPETDPRVNPEDSIFGLCLAFALARLMCIFENDGSETSIIDALTKAFRYIEHTSFYYNARVTIHAPETLLTL